MCRLRVTRIPNTLFLDCHAKIELRSIGPDRFQNPQHGSLASPERQGRPPDEGPCPQSQKNGQRADVINKRKLAELCTALSEDRVDESTSRNIRKAEPTSRRKLCPACSAADGDTGASMASGGFQLQRMRRSDQTIPSSPRIRMSLRRSQPGCRTGRGNLPTPGSWRRMGLSPRPADHG